ncbi:MAG: SH3 domain-containing protein [Micropepsaceae bacterium]
MTMLLRTILCILLLVSPALASASAIDEHLKPMDEGEQDPSFATYRASLKAAIKSHDVTALVKLLDPKIKLDFGGGEGIATFKRKWRVSAPGTFVWKALALIVENGGNFNSKTEFAAPYVYSAWPSDVDAFEFLAVTTKGAVMRSAPKADASIVRSLDYDILTVIRTASKPQHEATDKDWSEVKDAKGVHGFVLDRDLRSPIDYRAMFETRKGQWRMTVFLAGD